MNRLKSDEMNFTIRTARETDKTALEAFFSPEDLVGLDSYFERCFKAHQAGQREIFIADSLDDQQPEESVGIIGMVTLNYTPRYWLYQRLNIPEIQDLHVLSGWRRNGVGTALIAHAEARCRKKGRAQVGISVGLNPDFGPAQRLYVRLGYCPDGYGATYDRKTIAAGECYAVDDDLCLMMVKTLQA